MTIALLNQKGGIGKITFAQHLAGQWARQGKRITPMNVGQRGSPATGPSSAHAGWPREIAGLTA